MDIQVLEAAADSAKAGRAAALALVTAARGSTPRKPGAALVADPGGLVCGTVGGGALEARALEAASRIASKGGSALLRFDLEGAAVAGEQPICGGEAEITVIAISGSGPFAAARSLVAAGGSAVIVLRLGASPGLLAVLDGEGRAAWGSCAVDAAALGAALRGGLALSPEGLAYDPILAPERLLVLGGGHVGRALARVALPLGFLVTVADPRAEFSDEAALPPGAAAIRAELAAAVEAFAPTRRDYAVVVSPGHRGDLEAARALLGHELRYLGLIGSRRKTRMLLDQLVSEGFDPERVSRLCAPIGLDIGAETPEEIAVAIAAELIAYRRGGPCLSYLDAERAERRDRPYV